MNNLNNPKSDKDTSLHEWDKPIVMIVDDEESVLKTTEFILEDEGYQVELCSTGKDAIDKISKNISAVVLDINMPDLSGFQVFEKIKAKNPYVPIIFHTSMVTEKKDRRDIRKQFRPHAYVLKGSDPEQLLDTVASAVEFYENILYILRKSKENNDKLSFQVKKSRYELIEKTNELEKTNRELEDFVYIISHDLKEPLFTIGGFTSKLSNIYKDMFDDKGKLYINRIKMNIEKMYQKINEIMEVLKIGRVAYSFKNNDTGVIVKDVKKMLESKIKANKINVLIQDNLPTVLCDEERLKDAFSNLLTNAIKFMGNDNKRQIRIGCDKDGDYYKFFVEDTGIGIPAEYREQIFKIFRRLNDLETEGMGVGLAIVKKVVELHNGKIWVESPVNDGRGSRFCFTVSILKKC